MTTGFMGMTGTGQFDADHRPKNWREKILHLYPNGDAPLTAIMSKMSNEKTDDPEFNWFEKGLATQAGAITEVYINATLTTAYTTGGTAGNTLYINCSADTLSEFRPGHQILLRDTENYTRDYNCKVVAVTPNGASSFATVILLEDDRGPTDIASVDRMLIIGNMNAEGADMPLSIAYESQKLSNYTQIFRTPLSITRTAMKTKLRTGPAYNEMKREALEIHSIELEKSLIWGIPTERTGTNGKKERTSGGILHQIANYDGISNDYTLNEDYDATTWLEGGETWLDEMCSDIFRYGSREKLALVGTKTVLAIAAIIKNSSMVRMQLTPETKSYGISVMTWVTNFGKLMMIIHPLFSYEPTNDSSMVILDPKMMKGRYIDDTTFYKDDQMKNTGHTRRDGIDEEFLTEIGYEFHHAQGMAYLNGFGKDNPA